MSLTALYQQIDTLSADIASLITQNEFEKISEKLAQRLSLMKQLPPLVVSKNNEQTTEQLKQFLMKCQLEDQRQVEQLLVARSQVLADSKKQSKIKQAVTAYQQFSKS